MNQEEEPTKAVAEVMNATLKKVEEVRKEDLADYHLVEIGSGIHQSN